MAAGDPVVIRLYDDRADLERPVSVSPELGALLAYADVGARGITQRQSHADVFVHARGHSRRRAPLCGWLRLHLSLRGSATEQVTKGRTYAGLQVPTGRVTTTESFRRAWEQATQLARDRTPDVRHLMAAYPVVKSYHAGDFLRFRIDRRAWCLALADHLQRTASHDEIREWVDYERLAPEVLMPRYRPDLPAGADLLGVGREVEAFAMLIAGPRTAMPLSIGVFGAWGSGKSYVMTRVEERVAALAQRDGHGGPYLHRIAQVRFNAWHYSEGDVVASLPARLDRSSPAGRLLEVFDLPHPTGQWVPPGTNLGHQPPLSRRHAEVVPH